MEIAEDLHFVERGFLNGNHFVYSGAKPVLIDTGYLKDLEQTVDLVKGLGVDPAQVSLIVTTHSHCDHIGGHHYFQSVSGCDIALHRIGRHFIETRDGWSTWWRYYCQEAEFFPCARSLEDGDRLQIGPHEFRVLHVPGHAADGLALYHPKEKLLISSDALWESDMPVVTVRVEGNAALFAIEETLDKLEALDVRAVYPGHGPPFSDIKSAVARAREKTAGYFKNREKIGDDLLKRILVYTVLMKESVEAGTFLSSLMETPWYPETVDLYFNGEYEAKFEQAVAGLAKRGVFKIHQGRIYTTVKP